MKMPRIECGSCSRRIAAGMVAGYPHKGRVWRHDPPAEARDPGVLLSCPGSLLIIELPGVARQMEFPAVEETTEEVEEVEEEQEAGIDTYPLF